MLAAIFTDLGGISMGDFIGQATLDELSVASLLLNLTVGMVLSLVLKFHFEKFGSTLSGKKELAKIIPFLVLIVCLIISIVKSSLALSLGLVGALSIVRFRTPIKEPEELIYIFMCIAIGLGLGANQTSITVIATLFILVATSLYKWKFNTADSKNLYLSLSWTDSGEGDFSAREIGELVSSISDKTDLKRHDFQGDQVQLVFFIDVDSYHKVFDMVDSLKAQFPQINSSFIDQSRIPGI
jgi:hypothetical protein